MYPSIYSKLLEISIIIVIVMFYSILYIFRLSLMQINTAWMGGLNAPAAVLGLKRNSHFLFILRTI